MRYVDWMCSSFFFSFRSKWFTEREIYTYCQLCRSEIECHLFLTWLCHFNINRCNRDRVWNGTTNNNKERKKNENKIETFEMLNILMNSKLPNSKWWHMTRCWQHKRITRTICAALTDRLFYFLISPVFHCCRMVFHFVWIAYRFLNTQTWCAFIWACNSMYVVQFFFDAFRYFCALYLFYVFLYLYICVILCEVDFFFFKKWKWIFVISFLNFLCISSI